MREPATQPARLMLMLALALAIACLVVWMLLAMLCPLAPATFEHYDEGPTPILFLALERYASARGELFGRRTAKVERYDPLVPGAPSGTVRWQVVACFFKPDAPFGRCARLQVRVLTMMGPGDVPPTKWTFAIESEVELPEKPTTEKLLLL